MLADWSGRAFHRHGGAVQRARCSMVWSFVSRVGVEVGFSVLEFPEWEQVEVTLTSVVLTL